MSKDCNYHHLPVLYREVIQALQIVPDGIYVDCTVGGGGHSYGILERLSDKGILIALDRDAAAIEAAKKKLDSLNSKTAYYLIQSRFSQLREVLDRLGIDQVDGVVADLGVSSHQIDQADRGFSFRQDGPLDMRMNPQAGQSAADLINTLPEHELAGILRLYGEEKFSGRIARAIVARRERKSFTRTLDLVEVISRSVPAKSRREQHPAKRSFQALRIAVNGELDELEMLIRQIPSCVRADGGRVALISFHSLEDRIIKQTFKTWMSPCICPKDFPVCQCGRQSLGKVVNRKGWIAGDSERVENRRAHSARLRVFAMTKHS